MRSNIAPAHPITLIASSVIIFLCILSRFTYLIIGLFFGQFMRQVYKKLRLNKTNKIRADIRIPDESSLANKSITIFLGTAKAVFDLDLPESDGQAGLAVNPACTCERIRAFILHIGRERKINQA